MHYEDTQDKGYGYKVEQTFLPPFTPVKISDVDVAFPADVLGRLLPRWEDIPEDFRRNRNEWTGLVEQWFGEGLRPVPTVKEGLDRHDVWRHLKACMGSFQPAHEHKIAGVAYLLSLWTEPAKT